VDSSGKNLEWKALIRACLVVQHASTFEGTYGLIQSMGNHAAWIRPLAFFKIWQRVPAKDLCIRRTTFPLKFNAAFHKTALPVVSGVID
jgi:hypothetical protein